MPERNDIDLKLSVKDQIREFEAVEANWLEDVLAGLLINGVAREDIEIRRYTGKLDTSVLVKGVERYRHVVNLVPGV